MTAPKKKRVRLKLKKTNGVGTNGKLTDEIETEICKLIKSQLTLNDACEYVGIHRNAVWEWRAKGQANPESRYGQFERAVAKALMIAKAYLIHGVVESPEIKGKMFILKNRYPEEYRDRIWTELSGPGGTPVPVAVAPFNVNITLSQLAEAHGEFSVRSLEPTRGNGQAEH